MAVHKRKKKSLLSPDYDPWYGYDTYSDGFRIVTKKRFRLNSDKEIKKIEYERIDIKAVQFFHNYDTKLQKHTGLIITSTTEKELRKASKSSAGESSKPLSSESDVSNASSSVLESTSLSS